MCLQLDDGVAGQGGKEASGEAWGDCSRYLWLLPRLGYSAGLGESFSA